MGMGPIRTWDPSAGDYEEQRDGFAVLGNRSNRTFTTLGLFPTLTEAEEAARSQVKNGQWDSAFVVPTVLACAMKRN
jgi:hypothetical protein